MTFYVKGIRGIWIISWWIRSRLDRCLEVSARSFLFRIRIVPDGLQVERCAIWLQLERLQLGDFVEWWNEVFVVRAQWFWLLGGASFFFAWPADVSWTSSTSDGWNGGFADCLTEHFHFKFGFIWGAKKVCWSNLVEVWTVNEKIFSLTANQRLLGWNLIHLPESSEGKSGI